MSAKIQVNADNLMSVMKQFQRVTGQTIPALIKSHARIACVSLAHRTQPFSVGQTGKGKAYKAGTTRVANDIGKIVRDQKKLEEIMEYVRSDKIRERMQSYIASGNIAAVEKILNDTGIVKGWGRSERLNGRGQIAKTHQRFRVKGTGRTRNEADALYLANNSRQLDGYIKEAQRRVGTSKSGWGACAEKLRAIKGNQQRGIPVWARAKKDRIRLGVVKDNSKRMFRPSVKMKNKSAWNSGILSPKDREIALRDAKMRMIKFMQIAMARARKPGANINKLTSEATK